MGTGRTDEFRKDAVRIALTSGLTRRQVADDLGVGLSTLNKWVTAHRDTDVVSDKELDLARENERLRRENRILKSDRHFLTNATPGGLSGLQHRGRFKTQAARGRDHKDPHVAQFKRKVALGQRQH